MQQPTASGNPVGITTRQRVLIRTNADEAAGRLDDAVVVAQAASDVQLTVRIRKLRDAVLSLYNDLEHAGGGSA